MTVSEDLNATGTGFFGWLGSLASRITKLFVTDIDFSGTLIGGTVNVSASDGNIDTSGNVTAGYFSGDGSLLTNLPSGALGTSINTTEIEDGTIAAVDLAADSVNGTHIIDNVVLRNTEINGNLNVTQNVTIGTSTVYEEAGELIIDY